MITGEEEQQFISKATPINDALKEKITNGSGITVKETVFFRSYIISLLCIRNACRAGVITNMLLKEFDRAEYIQGEYAITVSNHKTSYQGPAILILEKDLYELMKMYRKQVHPIVGAALGQTFFKTNSGQEIRPCQDLTRLWHNLGVRKEKTINCTHFRKKIATMNCPLCGKKTTNTSRHIKAVHKMNDEFTKRCLGKMKKKNRTEMNKLPLKVCMLCNSNVVRLDWHLITVHHLKNNDKAYKKALLSTKKIPVEDDTCNFKTYLLKSRHYKLRQAKQCVSEFNQLAGGRDDNIYDARYLKHKVNELLETKTASTVRHFLTSAQMYLEYVTFELDQPAANVLKAQSIIRLLLKQLARDMANQRENKKCKINDEMITGEEEHQFISKATPINDALKEKIMNGSGITVKETMFFRSYIISLLCIRNACRAGVITNMLLKEFDRAENIRGEYAITISNHKTSYQGPAILILQKDLYELMTMYRKQVHPIFGAAFGQTFFKTNSGQEIRPCQDLTRLWHNLGVRKEKIIKCTHFRKQITTMSWQHNHRKKKRITAEYMHHSLNTQNAYYKAAITAKHLLRKIKETEPDVPSHDQAGEDDITGNSDSDDITGNSDSEVEASSTVEDTTEPPVTLPNCFRTRYFFSDIDIILLKTLFGGLMKEKITKEKVMAIYKQNESIQHMTWKCVYDKARNLQAEAKKVLQ
ncbi:uncharacterized protein LOC117114584 isoform X3 [Anneissia japonica]|nr:uncharacterized protein LOC117114584 isoform X3 [Anneissia japonica]